MGENWGVYKRKWFYIFGICVDWSVKCFVEVLCVVFLYRLGRVWKKELGFRFYEKCFIFWKFFWIFVLSMGDSVWGKNNGVWCFLYSLGFKIWKVCYEWWKIGKNGGKVWCWGYIFLKGWDVKDCFY